MIYIKVGGALSSRQFGNVHKAIDVDLGKFIAVKILQRPIRVSKIKDWKQSLYYALKRKVETLSKISYINKSSLTSYTHKTDIYTSYISLIISRYKGWDDL